MPTYREYRTWIRWLDNQWNNPSRTDWYLMQIAELLEHLPSRVWGRSPKRRPLARFKLLFKRRHAKKRKLTEREKKIQNELSKARWFGFTRYFKYKRKE